MTLPLRGYGAVYQTLTTLRDAIISELTTRKAPVNRAGVVPGAIAWDECDTCGLLALSGNRRFLTDQFPIEVVTTDKPPGGGLLAVDMVAQLVRCAPVPDARATAPSTTALNDVAQVVLDDAHTLVCVTVATLQQLKNQWSIADFMVRQCLAVGPEGACVGNELSFVVGFDQ